MHASIITKFIGPTTHRPIRVRATCKARSIVVPWDHHLGIDQNHRAAAHALASKLGWSGCWFGADDVAQRGSVWVRIGPPISTATQPGDSFNVSEVA